MRVAHWTMIVGSMMVQLMAVTVCQAKQDHGHMGKPDGDSGDTIGCYKCVSINGTNPACEDIFDQTDPVSRAFYKASCISPKFNKNGRPIGSRLAKRCYKLKATRESDKMDMIVRDCDTMMEGADPQDTIASTSYHCPTKIIIGSEVYSGCLLTCDFDGCNAAQRTVNQQAIVLPISLLLISITRLHHYF